jgi:hypothetical protein
MRKLFKLVGEITVEGLSAVDKNLKSVDNKARQLSKELGKLGKSVEKVGVGLTKGLTAPITALGAGMVLLAGKTGQYADKLLDLEQITGLTTDKIQGLENVARTAGVDFEGLTNTVQKFTSHLPQIAAGTGPSAQAIKQLGVNIFDSSGRIRDMNDLFPEMINKLQGMGDVTTRNTLAQQIFGAKLQNLAPVLGMTAEQFNTVMEEAKGMSGFMSKDALNSANDYRIATEKLKAEFAGIFRELSMGFIPLLKDTFIPIIKDSVLPFLGRLVDRVRSVGEWFNKLDRPVKESIIAITGLAVAMGPVLIVAGKLIVAAKVLIPIYKALILGQGALNAVMMANPIGMVVVAIGALVAAGIVMYKNWDTITYGLAQSFSYLKKLMLQFLEPYTDLLRDITKYIPGVNKATAAFAGKISELIEKSKEELVARKQARIEAKLHALETEKLKATIDAAKNSTRQYADTNIDLTETFKTQKNEVDEVKKKHEELLRDRVNYENEWASKFREEAMSRDQMLEWEYQEALSKADEYGGSVADIEAYYSLKRAQNNVADEKQAQEKVREELEKTQKDRLDKIDQEREKFQSKVDYVSGLYSNFSQLRENIIDGNLQKEIAAINASRMSEEQKQLAITAAQEKADKEKRKIARKQAVAAKVAGLFEVAINTAVGISKSLAQLGPIAGAIAAVGVGIAGALQAAVIASKPLPQLAKGGLAKRQRGGVDVTVAEGNQDELIMPVETGVQMFFDKFIQKLSDFKMPTFSMPQIAGAGAGGGLRPMEVNLNIGTFIGDDRALKELERKLYGIRVSEQLRRGE